tara:strand:+ start:1080 stop:1805 length:726 start_codon:yes stop_codon:yes gene_type:complete
MNLKIGIISGCTYDYYERMYVLYKSLRQFHKDVYFIAYMIGNNETNIEKENELKKIYENKEDNYLIYKQDIIKFENINHKRVYSSNIRINYLLENFKDYDCLFWMDADTIILKNIQSLFDKFNDYKILVYSHRENFKKLLSSNIGFRKCKKTNYILKNWFNEMKNKGQMNWKWFDDQKTFEKYLHLALEKYSHQKEFCYNIPYCYTSWSRISKETDYIIIGKGNSKYGKKYLHYQKKIFKK